MFVLSVVEDELRILPENFDEETSKVLTDEVDRKYANRVLQDVGLCICLVEFEHIGDAYIHPLDGNAHYKVRFKLLVFRPFVGEVITGRVLSCSEEGVRVTLGFFHEVTVPQYLLHHPSRYDSATQRWLWDYQPEDSSDEEGGGGDGFAIAATDEVRLRVRNLKFTKVIPSEGGRRQATTTTTGAGKQGEDEHKGKDARRQRSTSIDITDDKVDPPRMSMEGSMNEDGLGLLSWWDF